MKIYVHEIAFVVLLIVFFTTPVYGTVMEDKQPTLKEKLLKNAQEWNIMNVINQTLPLAERFEK